MRSHSKGATVMKKIGADVLIACLKEQGVNTVFGYPGGTVLDIYDALYRDGTIDHVITAHEQGAVHAADGYARTTGRTGVVIATSGPGATNLVTGLATAFMDSSCRGYGKRRRSFSRTGFLSGNRHHRHYHADHET